MDNIIDIDLIVRFKKVVASSANIIIVPHTNPDGDAIGASLALKQILENFNKKVSVIVPNDFPDFLQWIEGSNEVVDFDQHKNKALEIFEQADTLFMLDFNDFERSDNMSKVLSGFKGETVMIDHHPEPIAPCNLIISYTQVSSTCELLFRVLERADLLNALNVRGAEALFTGIMTDTGNFSYNASDPETYRIVAALLEKGIDKDQINANIYHTFSEDRWRLIGHSLKDKMVVLPEFNTAYITLTQAELDRYNFQPGDTEGLVNFPLMVKGIVFCVLFMERDDNVKLSLRSKGRFSVNRFARDHFNGGGHDNAAGGKSPLSMNDVIVQFESLLPQYKNQLLNSFN